MPAPIIVPLASLGESALALLTRMLHQAYRTDWPRFYTTIADARAEVDALMTDNSKIARAAVDGRGDPMGLIAAKPIYEGNVWQLHPLVVDPLHRKKGVGKALLFDLENHARARNGLTLWAACADENRLTTMSDGDPYPDLLMRLKRIQNRKNHPYEFLLKCGMQLAGMMPEASGRNRPDIFLAKRLQ